jgi:hypothetical protein
MTRKVIAIALMLVPVCMTVPIYRIGLDAVSAATASGGGGGAADTSQVGQMEHPSFALRVMLDAGGKARSAKLTAQIDGCFAAMKALTDGLESGKLDFDVMSMYLVIEEHGALQAAWTDKEKAQVRDQVKKIDREMPIVQGFLDAYDSGETDAAAAEKALRAMDDITTQYRIIQWMLYI